MKGFWAYLLAIMCCLPVAGWALTLAGKYTQGGYITGTLPPGTHIEITNQKPTINQNRFFFGFHREYPAEAILKLTHPDNTVTVQSFIITPQNYKTQHIKGVSQQTVTPNPQQVKRSRKEAAKIRAARRDAQPQQFQRFQWPVSGPITGVYGSRRTYNGKERSWHKGLDIAPPHGTPIRPIAAGEVSLALDTFFNGNLIIINHGLGVHSIYAHLDEMHVKVGEQVNKENIIGTVGNTGRSTGPHLHLGIYWHQTPLDPILFLPERNE